MASAKAVLGNSFCLAAVRTLLDEEGCSQQALIFWKQFLLSIDMPMSWAAYIEILRPAKRPCSGSRKMCKFASSSPRTPAEVS